MGCIVEVITPLLTAVYKTGGTCVYIFIIQVVNEGLQFLCNLSSHNLEKHINTVLNSKACCQRAVFYSRTQ